MYALHAFSAELSNMRLQTNFHLFGPAHLSIILSVPVCAGILSWISYHKPGAARWIRLPLATLLILSGLWWYWYRFRVMGVRLPQGLPLELCDISLWLTIYSLLKLNRRGFELAYYWGLGGAAMALLTPDLLAPLSSPSSINFFVRHCGLIIGLLWLLWSSSLRPRPRSWRFAFLALNLYAMAVGVLNFLFGTNYLYLRNKPASASLLDRMGAWPIYILSGDVLALILFLLMSIPFRNRDQELGLAKGAAHD